MAFSKLKRALSRSAQPTGFIHVYATQLVEPPRDLLDGVKGLLAIQPFRRGDGNLSFIAYWSSSEAAVLAAPVLQARINAGAAAASGVTSEPITKITSAWEWVKDKAVPLLLMLVAVIAALEGLVNRYEALIASPQFTLRFDQREYALDEGETKPASLTVENALSSVELTGIAVSATVTDQITRESSGTVEMYPLADASLPATKSRQYFMNLQIRHPGEHVIRAKVTANAGLFRPTKEVLIATKVIVWPSGAEATLKHLQTRQNRADFRVTMRVGKDAGPGDVTCHLTFASKFVKQDNYLRALGKPLVTDWVEDDSSTLVVVQWTGMTERSTRIADLREGLRNAL